MDDVSAPSASPRPGEATDPHGPAGQVLVARIGDVGERLAASVRRIIDGLPGRPDRPNQLADSLGVNRNISGRLLSAAGASDPLQVTHLMPGPDPLRKVLNGARKREVDAAVLDEAEASIREFERLIRDVAGDRPALDAIISSLLPGARGRFELAAKHSMFRGASLLKGALADLWLHAAIVHPSAEDDDHHDVAHIHGTLGLRRLRPDVTVKFSYRQFGTPQRIWRTLEGLEPGESDGRELDRFCRRRVADLEARPAELGIVYALAGTSVGPRSAVDKLFGEVRPSAMARHAAATARNAKSLFVAPAVPVKSLVFDVFLHEAVYPGSEPRLILYDTAVEGMASVNDPARDVDRLDLREEIVVLRRGLGSLVLEELPRYSEMIAYAFDRLGWEIDAFRGYRCRIQYPMHGCQVCMAFTAPPRTAQSSTERSM